MEMNEVAGEEVHIQIVHEWQEFVPNGKLQFNFSWLLSYWKSGQLMSYVYFLREKNNLHLNVKFHDF